VEEIEERLAELRTGHHNKKGRQNFPAEWKK